MKYNPGFLPDDELVAGFCVRKAEFDSMIQTIRESSGRSNKHQIVIGPRGSGKTFLLLRIVAEIRRDASLSSRFVPIVFPEESYEVFSVAQFWLECLAHLAEQAPTERERDGLLRIFGELREIGDERIQAERSLATLLDFCDREHKCLLLVVENFNMIMEHIANEDEGWRLRHTLQTEPSIQFVGSATSRFEEIDHPDRALFGFFLERILRPLDTVECVRLWKSVAGRFCAQDTIRALQILTGGCPRLLAIVARLGAGLSFRQLMADLIDLVDDHTNYFKLHIDALPPQERRVYLALARLWRPATTREIADLAKLDSSKCSVYLARLVGRGAVSVTGGIPRRKLYYLAERLYSIYYLLRRSRGQAPLVEALIRFMQGYYSANEQRIFSFRSVHEPKGFDAQPLPLYRTLLSRFVELPALQPESEVSGIGASGNLDNPDGNRPAPENAENFFDRIFQLAAAGNPLEALAEWAEHDRSLCRTETPEKLLALAGAYVNMGGTLSQTGQHEVAVAIWDGIVRCLEADDTPRSQETIAVAILNKGDALKESGRLEDALGVLEEVIRRFGKSAEPNLQYPVSTARLCRGTILAHMGRTEQALAVFEEVLQSRNAEFSEHSPDFVASALVCKGQALVTLNRPEEALTVWNYVDLRFGSTITPEAELAVSWMLVNKGALLVDLGRKREGLAVWDEAVERFGSSNDAATGLAVAAALSNKGSVTAQMGQTEDAISCWDEIRRRFMHDYAPPLRETLAKALVNKGAALGELNRLEDALEVLEEVILRFSEIAQSTVQNQVAIALLGKGTMLALMGRHDEGIAVLDELIGRIGSDGAPLAQETLAKALVNKGHALTELNRPEDALEIWLHVDEKFGSNDSLRIRNITNIALFKRSELELNRGRATIAIKLLDSILEQRTCVSVESRLLGYLLRSQAYLAKSNNEACEGDVKRALAIFGVPDQIPSTILARLSTLARDLDSARMKQLIKESPASDLLLPLTTALEKELGLESRVAREVEEIAEDISRNWHVAEQVA